MPRRLFLIVRAAVWTNFGINAAAVREEAVAARQPVRLALAMPEIHQAGLIELVESAKALAVIAVSVSTHEGTIAVPKTPLVAALQSALAGG